MIFFDVITSKPNSGFWKEINKYRGKKKCIAPTAEGLTDPTEISDRFAATYNELFNSVGYDVNDMNTLFHEVCGDVVDDYTVHSILMSSDDVTSAIKKLKPGKCDGYDGLSSENYCNGTPFLSRYISALFNCIITHCYVPNSFCISTIIPIPKGSNKSTSTVKNYRGIALSSLLLKIFDNCIISLQESCLLTDDLQFAYKSKTSTVQCISTITEIINYYIKNSSNLYMCTLYCTKAFDRVSLVLLFTKLRERKMNPLVLRCLIYTYCIQKVCINWNGAKSTLFSATNGVKQGGVLSPRLFNAYLNELLSKLRENGLWVPHEWSICGHFYICR